MFIEVKLLFEFRLRTSPCESVLMLVNKKKKHALCTYIASLAFSLGSQHFEHNLSCLSQSYTGIVSVISNMGFEVVCVSGFLRYKTQISMKERANLSLEDVFFSLTFL